jgi:uncharacterized protein with GYD domain
MVVWPEPRQGYGSFGSHQSVLQEQRERLRAAQESAFMQSGGVSTGIRYADTEASYGAYGAPPIYEVQQGDTLSGIVLKLGLATKGLGNTRTDWLPALQVAAVVADLNNLQRPPNDDLFNDRKMPLAPGNWNDIRPGQVLTLPGGDGSVTPAKSGSMWGWLALLAALGIGYYVYKSPKRKSGLVHSKSVYFPRGG